MEQNKHFSICKVLPFSTLNFRYKAPEQKFLCKSTNYYRVEHKSGVKMPPKLQRLPGSNAHSEIGQHRN
jgi:hypothetical protein